MPEPRRKSIREGAAHLVIGCRQVTTPIGEPNASGFANPDGHPESCRSTQRSSRDGANYWDEFQNLPEAISKGPPEECTSPDGPAELSQSAWRPRYAVADSEGPQHDRKDAGETAHTYDRNWRGACTSGGGTVPVNRRSDFRPYQVTLRVSLREVQRLECFGPSLLEGTPKHLKTKVLRWKSVFRQGEVNRYETRRPPGHPIEQSALMGKRLPQCMRHLGMRLVL
jgi:hypothetical protein